MTAPQETAAAAIAAESARLRELSLEIHAHPEQNYEERRAHAALATFLERAGWDVDRSARGIETAFEASAGGEGPVVAVLCEYDALPRIGHACGHNLIAAAGVGAGLGVAAALREHGIAGAVRVIGSPAEEGGGGKIKLIDAGAFERVGAAMMVHPGTADVISPSVLAIDTCIVEFRGRNAHAAAAPWEGRNSLDALVHAYNGVALLRQQLRPETRIHAVIHHGGEKPNVIPDRAAAEFYVRAKREPVLDETIARVEAVFRGAAEATGTEVEISWRGGRYSDLASNAPLARRFGEHFAARGVRAVDLEHPSDAGFGSTDMGNVSHIVPSIHPLYRIEAESGNHTAGFTAAAATESAHEATLRAAAAMAATALDWLADEYLREAAAADFRETHAQSRA